MIALLAIIAILLALILFAILNREGARRFLAGAWGAVVWLLYGAFALALLGLVWFVFHSMTWDSMVLLVVVIGFILVARWRGRIIGTNSVDAFGDRVDQYFDKREKEKQMRRET